MRRLLLCLLIIALVTPAAAKRREGWELDLGLEGSLNELLEEYFEGGPRVDFGLYDHQFYVGASTAWLYSTRHQQGDLRASLRAGWRLESARRPAFFSVFAELQYYGGPWGNMDADDAEPETDIFSIGFHPAICLRFTDWLAFNLEMPIAYPLNGEHTDLDLKARIFLYTYF
ncbi:MAG: hypothetical protein GF399_04095 [Candidatus Coatesbacteria bacterium]|nr:hypothetical protein [Candidatus Coatesbacteria bacterium]